LLLNVAVVLGLLVVLRLVVAVTGFVAVVAGFVVVVERPGSVVGATLVEGWMFHSLRTHRSVEPTRSTRKIVKAKILVLHRSTFHRSHWLGGS
jgi:uncharacterized protein YpuA (DUF1002 family)